MSDAAKINAARAALDFIEDGMIVGLGTGSTAAHFVTLLGERVKQGLRIQGVATSVATEKQAALLNIPLMALDLADIVHVDVDGADEIDPNFRLIKGGGGALLREKMVAEVSKRMVVIADKSKAVKALGAFPLPIEIVPFGTRLTTARVCDVLTACGATWKQVGIRLANGKPFVTDGGNFILDAETEGFPDPELLADALKRTTGVVEHGLFLGVAETVILGSDDGVTVKSSRAL
ncbi:MAG TPA: ribose-5-phosphate isomerase RpiA [Caulobacterales bacterium]|nr:ribose-5-phosphate isomerase RpiA [Caulobacterales bacterium]